MTVSFILSVIKNKFKDWLLKYTILAMSTLLYLFFFFFRASSERLLGSAMPSEVFEIFGYEGFRIKKLSEENKKKKVSFYGCLECLDVNNNGPK